ncbi:MAG TPA: trehalose-phosphatase [Candidatus Acidoferrales bacterium]|nr:trehalose-phosphatase [Candidatus Acidoferrales bacterium]
MIRTRRVIPHLFAQWDRIARRIREKKRLVMFLDFDGTLVRIAPMPTGVRLEDETRGILRKLAGRRNVTFAVISGRQRAELQRYVGIRNLKYLGLYGWESKGNQRVPFPVRLALVRTLVSLLAELPSYPGVWIEPKRSSFSVHLLGASAETQRQMRRQVRKRVRPLRETLRLMSNLRDVEVAPISIGDKGAAARKGITILVGKRRTTQAQFSLRGPAEVAAALSRMGEIIR